MAGGEARLSAAQMHGPRRRRAVLLAGELSLHSPPCPHRVLARPPPATDACLRPAVGWVACAEVAQATGSHSRAVPGELPRPHAHACAAVVRCAARAAPHSPWLACPWRRSGTGSVAQAQQSVPTTGARPPAPQAPLAPVPQVPASQSFLAHFGNLLSWATTPRAAVPRSSFGGRAVMGSPMAPYTAYANSLATSLVAPGVAPGEHAASLPVDLG